MKAKLIHEMTDAELNAKLRFRHATGQLENPNVLNTVKKDIARVKTVIREREIKKA